MRVWVELAEPLSRAELDGLVVSVAGTALADVDLRLLDDPGVDLLILLTDETDGGELELQVDGRLLQIVAATRGPQPDGTGDRTLTDPLDGTEAPIVSSWTSGRLPPAGSRTSLPEGPHRPGPPMSATDIRVYLPFPFRVPAEAADKIPAPDPIAGVPGGAGIPPNGAAVKQLATYLEVDGKLQLAACGSGSLIEYETICEPLGWALDEWVETMSLAPFEDTRISDVAVDQGSRTRADGSAQARQVSEGSAKTQTELDEQTAISGRASGASRGLSAGFGGTTPSGTAVNPLDALVRGITGSLQLGYSSARAVTDSASSGLLARDIGTSAEARAQLQRDLINASLLSTDGTQKETRRLRAFRNLSPDGRAHNLAVFSIVRQWLVTTREGRRRPITFIPAWQLDKDFTAYDVFLHAAAIDASLLDDRLKELLWEVSDGFSRVATPGPAAAKAPAPIGLRVTATVTDSADGDRSEIRLTVVDGADSELASGVVRQPRAGQDVTMDLRFDAPVSEPVRLVWELTSGGSFDKKASLSGVREVWVMSPDIGATDRTTAYGHALHLTKGKPYGYWRKLPQLPDPLPVTSPPAHQRLLDHLNAFRGHYRVAIDLLRDPVSRFVELAGRADVVMPADLTPVGLAGAHLAFFAAEDDDTKQEPNAAGPGQAAAGPDGRAPQVKPRDDKSFAEVVSAPTGATFVEVVQSSGGAPTTIGLGGWPQVDLGKDETLVWPVPTQQQITSPGPTTLGFPDPTAPPAASAPGAGLPDQVELLKVQVTKLADVLAALQSKADPKAEEEEDAPET